MTDESKRPDIAVPEGSSERGPFLRGELRKGQFTFPDILAQFERITPHTRKTRIFLLLTADQAKKLYVMPGPFTFEGSFCTRDGVIETRLAKDIWLKPITQITHQEAFYWTQTSGAVGSLEVRMRFTPGSELDSRRNSNFAWFVARPCFALAILANQTKEEAEESVKYNLSRPDINFSLTDDAKASILRYPYLPFHGAFRNVKLRAYSIAVEGVKDPFIARRDVDVLILLASFASRQRSVSSHWSYETREEFFQFWQFNFGKFPKRYEREEPIVPRDRDECSVFVQAAFAKYFAASQHQSLVEAAIYALLNESTTLEVEIARLFSAIQGALYFATQLPLDPRNRPRIGSLYRAFLKAHPNAFSGLWPLVDPQAGPPLSDLRNAVVHGEAFAEQEWTALSYAGEHLRWHLERIILLALGWDIEKSAVSPRALGLFNAYQNWKQERDKLANRLSPR